MLLKRFQWIEIIATSGQETIKSLLYRRFFSLCNKFKVLLHLMENTLYNNNGQKFYCSNFLLSMRFCLERGSRVFSIVFSLFRSVDGLNVLSNHLSYCHRPNYHDHDHKNRHIQRRHAVRLILIIVIVTLNPNSYV